MSATECRLQATDYGLQATDYRLRNTGYGLQATDYGLRNTGYGLQDLQSSILNLQPSTHGSSTAAAIVAVHNSFLSPLTV